MIRGRRNHCMMKPTCTPPVAASQCAGLQSPFHSSCRQSTRLEQRGFLLMDSLAGFRSSIFLARLSKKSVPRNVTDRLKIRRANRKDLPVLMRINEKSFADYFGDTTRIHKCLLALPREYISMDSLLRFRAGQIGFWSLNWMHESPVTGCGERLWQPRRRIRLESPIMI